MGVRPGLLEWQWKTYPRNHTLRITLAVHLFAVPAFVFGLFSALVFLVAGAWISAPISLAMSAVAFGLQGIAHRLEPEPPIPFDGPADAFTRIFVEQLVTFPRFLFGGELARAWKSAGLA